MIGLVGSAVYMVCAAYVVWVVFSNILAVVAVAIKAKFLLNLLKINLQHDSWPC